MMRILIYSHDAYGLGNICRMLTIAEHLLEAIPELSILLLSGSPMLQSFRLPRRLDYIKLPCLNRGDSGQISSKYLDTNLEEVVRLRSDLILSAASHFKPDVFLVDKKPFGLENELAKTIKYLRSWCPRTKLVLVLRDILDAPEKTIKEWQKNSYPAIIEKFYDQLLVVGESQVFDFAREYQLSTAVANKIKHCGYLGRPPGLKNRDCLRQELDVKPDQHLVLVTPGGGEDGYPLIRNYLAGLALLPTPNSIKSLIFSGPEMSAAEKASLNQMAESYSQVHMYEFSNDLMSYMAAADVVVAMGGYNTICEILSARKPAVVVPRIRPSQEQIVRAEKMIQLGIFAAIHPEQLTPEGLIQTVLKQLGNQKQVNAAIDRLNLDGNSQITREICNLLGHEISLAATDEFNPLLVAA
jgi:predicted glycosyltransferase